MPLNLPRFFLIFCLLCVSLGELARAERKPAPTVGTAPPQPVELNLKIHREGTTEIPLRIYGKANEPLKYLIRTPPLHGKLSDPRQTEREVSVVVYDPPADLGITTDKFTYAVQSGVGVSAAVEVTVTIVDQPPRLGIQDTIDFSSIRAGGTNSRLLEISNQGGMIASGEVIVDSPWKIDGKSGYRLRNGDVAVFKIIFAPTVGGKFDGVARYTSEPEHSTTLRGVAESAIVATPAQWVLQQIPGDVTRSGTFDLINQLDEPRTLQLKTDGRLKIPAQVTIPAHGSASIPIEASPENVQAMDTEIRLEARDFSIEVPVRVPALGPVFRSNTATSGIEFGRLPPGQKGSARFEIENIGGAPGNVSWEISPPFSVSVKGATLQPGEKKEFPIEIDSKIGGKYRTWLKFHSGAQSFDILVDAEVTGGPKHAPAAAVGAPVAAVPSSGSSSSNPGESPEQTETAPPPRTPYVAPDWAADIQLPQGVRVEQITPTSAVIVWPAGLSLASHFRVEMRQMQIDHNGKLQISWVSPTDVPIEAHGPNYAAVFKGLKSNELWTVRIIAMPANGEPPTRLFTIDFATPPQTSFVSLIAKPSLTQLLVIALIGLLGWQAWQRWKY